MKSHISAPGDGIFYISVFYSPPVELRVFYFMINKYFPIISEPGLNSLIQYFGLDLTSSRSKEAFKTGIPFTNRKGQDEYC